MSLDNDPWIELHSPISAEKLHALGNITFCWNGCEYWTGAIFSIVADLDQSIGRVITHDLGDVSIWQKIKLISLDKKMKPEIINLLDHAAKIYDRCRTNRNTYVHASGGLIGRGGLSLMRRKGPTQFGDYIPDGLEDLRRVSEELIVLNRFLQEVAMYIMDVREGIRVLPPPSMPDLPKEVWVSPKKSVSKRAVRTGESRS
ncbi:MAG: hypothetical protein WCJ52_09225 [Phenylobacterium sp.]|uniref:hypothetical protein n=1 Tax=Phenylobacterium sp. TaxID=1871053 RepID=UPI00301A9732